MKKVMGFLIYQLTRLKEALLAPSITIQYPYVRKNLPLLSRTSLRLDTKECTGCLRCELKCPVAAISFQTKEFFDEIVLPTSSTGHIFERRVVSMKVNYANCIFCGICVDECQPKALTLASTLPPVGTEMSDLIDNLVKTKELPKVALRAGTHP